MKTAGRSLVCVFICAVAGFAQSERGSIRGTVHDATGAVIPGAKVTAQNVATGIRFDGYSTDAGNYNIPQLPVGTYNVSAEKEGFRKYIRENVKVDVSATVGLDLPMEVGSVSESVTVAALAPQLKSESSEVSTVVSTKGFNDLPINAGGGRAPETMLYLTPGFSGNTFDAHINGSQTLSKEMQIDGMSTVIAEIQGDPRTLTFPPDVVQEMSVMGSSYPAEFGNTGGGVERMVIKSGTNELHGSMWEFLRNEHLDARGFYNARRSVHHENEYGFMVGGPVWIPKLYKGKNKTFWMASIDWYKNRGGAQNSIASVPDDAFRTGDLSGLRNSNGSLLTIYDPNSTRTVNGVLVRDPFTGNVIPSSRISKVSQNILSFVPKAQVQSVFNNYPASGNSQANNHDFTIKADHYISSNHRISGMVNRGVNLDNGPYAALPHPVESSRDGFNGQTTGRFTYDWTIRPSLLNEFRVGFNRQHQHLVATEMADNWGQKVGISGITNGFPVVNSWGGFTPLAQNQDDIQPVSNTFLFADSVSWTKSKHNFKFGMDLRRLQHNGIYPSRPAQFGFGNKETAFPSGDLLGTTGSGYASFLLGLVDSGSMYINDVVSGNRLTQFAAYAQDDWKLTPRLTLNLGLRWDLFLPMTETADRMSIMDPSKPNPVANNLPGAYVFAGNGSAPHTGTRLLTSMQNTYYKAFGPRLGLAWRVTEKAVIRTAYGISYSAGGGLGGGNVVGALDGFSGTASFPSLTSGLTPAFVWDGGFPQNYDHPPFINAGLNVNGGANMWGDKAYIPGDRQDWNFGTEYQLPQGTLLDIAYVGSKSTRLDTGAYNVNQLNPSYLSLGADFLRDSITDPAVVAAGYKAPYATFGKQTLAQSLRPYPQYHGIGYMNSANIGNMTYNSMQVKVEHQFSKGLFLLSSYTFSKTLTDANSTMSSFFSPVARDSYNRRLEKALAIYDQPQRWVTAFNYELPFGPGKPIANIRGPIGKILQGWQVNGILTYGSGAPIGVAVNNTLPLFNSGNTPNSVTGANPMMAYSGKFDPHKDLYLNIAAFSVPASGTFGTSAQILPNARTFFNLNEDVGFMKRTYIREQMNIEFRFEMFNLFNRVVFGGPGSNVSVPQTFGLVSGQANGPRNGQFALKFNF